MKLFRLSFASFLLIAAAAVFTIAFGNEQAAKSETQLCKHQYALCTSALCIPQPGDPTKAIAFALWKRARAWLRRRVTRSSLALMPMASARCTPHSHSNNLSRVRKFLPVLVVLPGRGASISVAPSIHRTPRKRSVSATCCELENGLHWEVIVTPALARRDIGPAQR
jgi:hypothetical protein